MGETGAAQVGLMPHGITPSDKMCRIKRDRPRSRTTRTNASRARPRRVQVTGASTSTLEPSLVEMQADVAFDRARREYTMPIMTDEESEDGDGKKGPHHPGAWVAIAIALIGASGVIVSASLKKCDEDKKVTPPPPNPITISVSPSINPTINQTTAPSSQPILPQVPRQAAGDEAVKPSTIGCGTIIPNVHVRCAGRNDPVYAIPLTQILSQQLSVIKSPEVCSEVSAQLAATCEDQTSSKGTIQREFKLAASAKVKCEGDAEVRPVWRIPITAPPGKHTLHVIVKNGWNTKCRAKFPPGGLERPFTGSPFPNDDIFQISDMSDFVIIDCSGKEGESGLAIVECWNGALDPKPVSRSLDLTIRIDPK